MTSKTAKAKAAQLSAGLSPVERARLLARYWRERDTTGVQALRDNVTGRAAIDAYNSALAVLRGLNTVIGYSALITGFGIERDVFALHDAARIGMLRRSVSDALSAVWALETYPLTRSEYRVLCSLDREILFPVGEYLSQLYLERVRPELEPYARAFSEASRAAYRATLSAQDGAGDDDTDLDAAVDEAFEALWAILEADIAAGKIPPMTLEPLYRDRGDDAVEKLPRGVLSDWVYGTTAETYDIEYPRMVIPAFDFYLGDADWEHQPPAPDEERRDVEEIGTWGVVRIYPDTDIDVVRARRERLRKALQAVVRRTLRIEQKDLDALGFDPPATMTELDAQEALRDRLQHANPDAGHWDVALNILRGYATRKAEARAYADIVAQLQDDVFGGEDPLDAHVREALESLRQKSDWGDETIRKSLHYLRPWEHSIREGFDWEPELDDPEYYEEVRREVLDRVREG